jgi:hypothetical protein
VKCLQKAPGARHRNKRRINASDTMKSLHFPGFSITCEDRSSMIKIRTKKLHYLVLHDKSYLVTSNHGTIVSAMVAIPNTHKRAGHTFRNLTVQPL